MDYTGSRRLRSLQKCLLERTAKGKPMNVVAIYARVSTDKQSHENQMPELLACNPQMQFVDYATGKNTDRDEFQRMTEAAERHEFDELVFWSLDRFGRTGILGTLQDIAKLRSLGIKVRCLHDDIDDELMLSIKAWVAKQERLKISERTKAGMRRVMATGTASGKPVGRPRTGLESRCRELRQAGLSFLRIAVSLNVSASYVRKACLADA
jgi:DNA invertase Pin-like site-specific DNA recombinase